MGIINLVFLILGVLFLDFKYNGWDLGRGVGIIFGGL